MESFHDRISEFCLNFFNKLPKTGKPTSNEWTVLSCIVSEKHGKFQVISLGTGSKCIGYDRMSPKGDILNDSHAEIICRRAFLRYLYETILSQNTDIVKFSEEKQKFYIDDQVKFHFFTTHVPCGDAAIFPKHNQEDFGQVLNETEEIPEKRLKAEEDIYRTGAKCLDADNDMKLPGVDFHILGAVRTKPGRGVRTLSVSCSDKLAKWCYLGIQGALVSLLFDRPIYLSSFTIVGGTPFDQSALNRALYQRLDGAVLTLPYKCEMMQIGQSIVEFEFMKCDTKTPCPSSIYWYKGYNKNKLEVAVEGKRQGITKKQINTNKARLKLCKIELFNCFQSVIKQYNLLEKTKNLNYKQTKFLANNYQENWQILRKKISVWTVKNENLLKFHPDTANQ